MKKMTRRRALLAAACAAVLAGPAAQTHAATRTWIAHSGSWTVDSNWAPNSTAPHFGDSAIVTQSGDFQDTVIFDAILNPQIAGYASVTVQSGSPNDQMTLSQSANLMSANVFQLAPTGVGIYNLSGGLATIGTTTIGALGQLNLSGTAGFFTTNLTQNGGQISSPITGSTDFEVSGTYAYNGGFIAGTIISNGTFIDNGGNTGTMLSTIVTNGVSTFNSTGTLGNIQNHGAATFNGSTFLDSLTTDGSCTLLAGHSLATDSFQGIRQNSGTFTQTGLITSTVDLAGGVWNQSAGVLNATSSSPTNTVTNFDVGLFANATFNLSGTGQVNVGATTSTITSSEFAIGKYGNGTFLQNAGTVNVTNATNMVVGGAWIDVGSRGLYQLTTGVFNVANDCTLVIGQAPGGVGTFIQSGGVANAGTLIINEDFASNGSFFLSGGSFTANQLINNGNFNVSNGTFTAFFSAVNNGTCNITGGSVSLNDLLGIGSLSVTGGASVFLPRIEQSSLFIGGGSTVRGGGGVVTSRLKSFTIEKVGNAYNGTFDLNALQLILDYSGASPIDTVRQELASGYNNGSWNGTGIIESLTHDSFFKNYVPGYAESSVVLGPNGGIFGEQQVDGTAVLMEFSLIGDTNLDGRVDVTDLGNLASHWQKTGEWQNGDFNYDGTVNVSDLGMLASNWQQVASLGQPSFQQALAEVGLSGALVPEPLMGSALGFALLTLNCRRKRG